MPLDPTCVALFLSSRLLISAVEVFFLPFQTAGVCVMVKLKPLFIWKEEQWSIKSFSIIVVIKIDRILGSLLSLLSPPSNRINKSVLKKGLLLQRMSCYS